MPAKIKSKDIPEKQISKQIAVWLDIMPSVVWFQRLNSGKVLSAYSGRWMQLCAKGTPDFIALVNSAQTEKVEVLFIEVKSKIGRLSDEQKTFESAMSGLPNVHYIVARCVSDVTSKINELS